MSKIAIVYWSGTGNTEVMANAVLEGVQDAGAEGTVFPASEFSPAQLDSFDAFAFGCPSMGVESLEDGEFEPMFRACEPLLSGKKLALFLRLGRRRMDAQLGRRLPRRRRGADLRQRHLLRGPGQRGRGKMPPTGGCPLPMILLTPAVSAMRPCEEYVPLCTFLISRRRIYLPGPRSRGLFPSAAAGAA